MEAKEELGGTGTFKPVGWTEEMERNYEKAWNEVTGVTFSQRTVLNGGEE